jgi:hypothetical protein
VQERRDETGVGAMIEVWRDERGGGASRETMMTETMMMEKKTKKKLIPNLLSAHPRAEKAP